MLNFKIGVKGLHSSKKQLGVFLGARFVSVVEIENQTPAKTLLLDCFQSDEPSFNHDKNFSPEIRLAALLQKSFRDNKISTTDVLLSLPSKDVLFRSFVVPNMSVQEMKGVVEFEARKYIPIKITDLTYTFHPVLSNEKDSKTTRILFAAVKNNTLENYYNIFEQAGFKLNYIEPGAMSLVRALLFKNLLSKDKRVAVIHADDKEGKIVIVEKGIPHFMRDFQLLPPSHQKAERDHELINARIFNEVRISLDYFGRLNPQNKIDEVFALKNSDDQIFIDDLSKELNLQVRSVKVTEFFPQQTMPHPDLVSAFGIGLKQTFPLPVQFDLSRKIQKAIKLAFNTEKTPVNYNSLLKIGAICLGVVALFYFYTQASLSGDRKRLAELQVVEEKFQNVTPADIQIKTTALTDQLNGVRKVRVKSQVSFLLFKVAKLMPENGAWLREISLQYTDLMPKIEIAGAKKMLGKDVLKETNLELSLRGYVYLENVKQQIRLVNTFVESLKKDEFLKSLFQKIDLASAQNEGMSEYSVTSFKVDSR